LKPEKHSDVIILGGGIAGMTAAIYTARANLSAVIVDTMICGGLVNSSHVLTRQLNTRQNIENILQLMYE